MRFTLLSLSRSDVGPRTTQMKTRRGTIAHANAVRSRSISVRCRTHKVKFWGIESLRRGTERIEKLAALLGIGRAQRLVRPRRGLRRCDDEREGREGREEMRKRSLHIIRVHDPCPTAPLASAECRAEVGASPGHEPRCEFLNIASLEELNIEESILFLMTLLAQSQESYTPSS